MTRLRVAVLISGRGSNLAALIDAAKAPDYPAEIALVLSNKEDAGGLAVAREAGVPVRVISHKVFATRDERTACDKCIRGHPPGANRENQERSSQARRQGSACT